mmetsp:Transcript_46156/g.98620  ORF Transcript_46156/g.98620 Transcript_46156/m.98620 type:complete len:298 (-) Transcript_46156:52-945(-)
MFSALVDSLDLRLELLKLHLALLPALDQLLCVFVLDAFHLLPEYSGLLAGHLRFFLVEPLHALLLGDDGLGGEHLLLLKLILELGDDLIALAHFGLSPLLRLLPEFLVLLLRLSPLLLSCHEFLLELGLLAQLLLVLLHQGAVLPQLTLQVRLQALRLLLEERLQHGEELPALHTRHFAFLGVRGYNLRTLSEHMCQAILALLLVVLKAQLLLLLHVARDVECIPTAEVQILQDEAKPSACLTRSWRVQDFLVLTGLDLGPPLCIAAAARSNGQLLPSAHPCKNTRTLRGVKGKRVT